MTSVLPVPSRPDEDDFADAHRDLLADPQIQFQLPAVENRPSGGPDWLASLVDLLNSEAVRAIFWVMAGLVGLFILYQLAIRFLGWSPPWRRPTERADSLSLQPEPAMARQFLAEADRLAQQGNYSEAAHLLLFRSLEDLERRRPGLVRPALTSRDIGSLPELPNGPRAAFAKIAAAVERGLFARRTLGLDEWQDCRQAYERFALAEGWQG